MNLPGGSAGAPGAHTTFVVTHGSQPRFQIDEIAKDMLRAVRFIRAQAVDYGVDPAKLGISGGSAGGHLSLMVATQGGPGDPLAAAPVDRESSAVQAVASHYPPTHFLDWSGKGDGAVGVGGLSWLSGAFGPEASSHEGPRLVAEAYRSFRDGAAGQHPRSAADGFETGGCSHA